MNEHNVSDMALAVVSVSASVARGPVASAIPLTGRSSMVSLDRMIAFYRAYPILPQAVAKLSDPSIGPEKGGRKNKLNELREDAAGANELKGVTDRTATMIGVLSQ